MIDPATRWVELHSVSKYGKSSENISLIVDREWFCRYPRPTTCIFDNGTEFSSEFYELLHSYGVHPKPTTVKNPQANAIVERIHLTIADSLRAQRLDKRTVTLDDINGILQATAFGLRATYHTALRATPGQVTFGRDMIINSRYLADWKYIADQRKRAILKHNNQENKRRLPHTYRVNDQVYLTTTDIRRKLDAKLGPFRIVKVNTNGTVAIQRSPTVTEVVNLRRLHPVF